MYLSVLKTPLVTSQGRETSLRHVVASPPLRPQPQPASAGPLPLACGSVLEDTRPCLCSGVVRGLKHGPNFLFPTFLS